MKLAYEKFWKYRGKTEISNTILLSPFLPITTIILCSVYENYIKNHMASNDDEKLKEQQIWNVNKTLSENLKMNIGEKKSFSKVK